MFTNVAADTRKFKQNYRASEVQRARVYWLHDQIVLSVYHKRPRYEIEELMTHLAAAIAADPIRRES